MAISFRTEAETLVVLKMPRAFNPVVCQRIMPLRNPPRLEEEETRLRFHTVADWGLPAQAIGPCKGQIHRQRRALATALKRLWIRPSMYRRSRTDAVVAAVPA